MIQLFVFAKIDEKFPEGRTFLPAPSDHLSRVSRVSRAPEIDLPAPRAAEPPVPSRTPPREASIPLLTTTCKGEIHVSTGTPPLWTLWTLLTGGLKELAASSTPGVFGESSQKIKVESWYFATDGFDTCQVSSRQVGPSGDGSDRDATDRDT